MNNPSYRNQLVSEYGRFTTVLIQSAFYSCETVNYACLIVRVDNIFLAERIEEELNVHEPIKLSIETERVADGHDR